MTYYLAIDIGASSGRHILGYLEDGKLKLEEVYRFENGFKEENGTLAWDMEHLVQEVKQGIRRCGELGKHPKTVAIDTWGVDYVLLDGKKKEILPACCYRDSRTEKTIPVVEAILPPAELYQKAGIQKQPFNTIYQLYDDKLSGKLAKAKHLLLMPSYLSYKLTGVTKNEYTFASTTSMVNAVTKQWDKNVIRALGYPEELFGELCLPGEVIGGFTEEMKAFAGFDATVIFAPSHDTASAVAACPMGEEDLYISSGTWSLIGMESREPIITDAARKANFANEGGIEYRFRFLKNYMGMWLLQNIRRNLNKSMTYDEMMLLAQETDSYRYLDVNDSSFMAPENMVEAIKAYCGEPDMSLGQVLSSVYHSLANAYKLAVEEIESLTGRTIDTIHIVGGGCQDRYLNQLTAQYTGKPVTAGPVEATAVGNLISQLLYDGACKDLAAARALVLASFER